ncbi:MAG: hypothetical protein LBV72_16225 [Tannerella sp.]|jgi:hypothetical protein|nr:hypothetical protein [Tannerella sp.]
MKNITYISKKWWFFLVLLVTQSVLLPFASRNFDMGNINDIIYTTLGNAFQTQIGTYNVYFQTLSLLMLILLVVFRNKMKLVFTIYVAVSYIAFAFIQNIAITEKYGLSIVTVNLVMFLFVAYVWIREIFQAKNDYSFSNFRWKYSWMIILSLFAYLCPISANGGFDFNPVRFFYMNSATAFCLTTPLFLTILTLNIPNINIVTYRITAIIGVIIGLYNMMSFFNPDTINLGVLHIPLLVISLYSCILSYKIDKKK